jgi:hypothetical protein
VGTTPHRGLRAHRKHLVLVRPERSHDAVGDLAASAQRVGAVEERLLVLLRPRNVLLCQSAAQVSRVACVRSTHLQVLIVGRWRALHRHEQADSLHRQPTGQPCTAYSNANQRPTRHKGIQEVQHLQQGTLATPLSTHRQACVTWPMVRPDLPRKSSSASGFFFWGIKELYRTIAMVSADDAAQKPNRLLTFQWNKRQPAQQIRTQMSCTGSDPRRSGSCAA